MLRTYWKTDVDLLLDVTKDGSPEDLSDKSVTVYGIVYKSMNRGDVYKCILPIQKTGSTVLIHFTSEYQKYPGVYSLFLVVNEGMSNSMSTIVQNAVYFYYPGFYTDNPILQDQNNSYIDTYQLNANLISLKGKSAYEIAVSNGFVGTESEWVQSLQGESLYEIYVDKGLFSGTEDQFLIWYRDQLRQDISDLSTISSSDKVITDYENLPQNTSVPTLRTIQHLISDVRKIVASYAGGTTSTIDVIIDFSTTPPSIKASIIAGSVGLSELSDEVKSRLSSNDFTDELKSKLDSVQEGANKNVQSDWNDENQDSDSFIKNKPSIGEGTLTIYEGDVKLVTFGANQTTNASVVLTPKTSYYRTSNLTGNSGIIPLSVHNCGILPNVQSYLGQEQVFCDIAVNESGDVIWHTSTVMTEESKFKLVITGK